LSKHAGSYRAWAELLKRTFDIDVLDCPKCHGRMKLLITDGKSIERHLAKLGEPTDVPGRSPSRGPPYWKSGVLRLRKNRHHANANDSCGSATRWRAIGGGCGPSPARYNARPIALGVVANESHRDPYRQALTAAPRSKLGSRDRASTRSDRARVRSVA
jgi:hypothetical protein